MNTIYLVMQVHCSDFNIICNRVFTDFTSVLTLILLMWNIGWAPNNVCKWQMGFNSAFKGLIHIVHANSKYLLIYLVFVLYIYIYIKYKMCMNFLVFILYFQPVAFIV